MIWIVIEMKQLLREIVVRGVVSMRTLKGKIFGSFLCTLFTKLIMSIAFVYFGYFCQYLVLLIIHCKMNLSFQQCKLLY